MIIPAILTDKKDELIKMADLCSEFTDYVQIDIMDGNFVPSKSVNLEDLAGCNIKIRFEAHLMVQDPLAWVEAFKKINAEKIIYHFEIDKDHLEIVSKIKEHNLKVGIAINPPTNISDFEYLVGKVDSVLFMAVNPGFYGAEFIPQVLDKIKEFKSKYPEKLVGIDGGVKLDNLLEVKEAGTDQICIGSAIFKDPDPKVAYQKFTNL